MAVLHPIQAHYQRRYERRVEGSWSRSTPKDATHIIIEIQHGPYCTSVPFLTGETEESRQMAGHLASQVERLLELAYERGDAAARADIRRALQGEKR